MAFRLRWSPRSVSNLEDICNFISKDSEHYARLFAKRINITVQTLLKFPESGRIVYRIKEDCIEIVTISHGARLLNSI
ncbi:MAG: type II toxin-antitoxin system RelE/ParE family toxin [Bacteroidota bacterium]|nr:type II toxin-antitoxin system RelE/ParE family toxin [Bacteroidota bacterium]